MNDSRTALVILVLSDPHLLESGQSSKNRTSDPDGIFAMILIFMVDGARVVISFCMRSARPGKMELPPDNTTL